MKKPKMKIGIIFFLVLLIFIKITSAATTNVNSVDYTCFVPDSLNDTTYETIHPSFGGEPSLQEVVNNSGYNISTANDETNIQLWHVENNVILKINYIGKHAAANQTFGYYLNHNSSTFIPLFATGFEPHYNVTQVHPGDNFTIMIPEGSDVGFGMISYLYNDTHRYYTENALNPGGIDHVLVFDLVSEFVLGFENSGGDFDYQDLIVSVKKIHCDCSERYALKEPQVWIDNSSRQIQDDNVQAGRNGISLVERIHNYAFEGEKISYQALVIDSQGKEAVKDVFVGLDTNGNNSFIESNCYRSGYYPDNISNFNVKINEQKKSCFNDKVMEIYNCTFTVETPESMYGEHFVNVNAQDIYGAIGSSHNSEFWFFNPVIALSTEGNLSFTNVREGTTVYSNTMRITNDVDSGSGVILDMFISGTDFYDSASSGTVCPTTNQLSLAQFRYFSTNGAYSTLQDSRKDNEGYIGINYGDHWDKSMYGVNEIIQAGPAPLGYWAGNTLSPGSDLALTLKLNVPEPCKGNFDSGSIYFWGEAV